MTLLSFFSMAIGWVVVRAAQFRGLCPVRSPSALVWPYSRRFFSCTGRPRSAPFGSSNVFRRELNNWLFYYFYMVVGLWVLVKLWLSYTHSCRWSGGDCHVSWIWRLAEVQRNFFFACSQTYANPCNGIYTKSGIFCHRQTYRLPIINPVATISRVSLWVSILFV